MRASAQAEKNQQRQTAPPVFTWQAKTRPFLARPQSPQAMQLKERIDTINSRPSVLPQEPLVDSINDSPREPQQNAPFGSINNSPRLVGQSQHMMPFSGAAAVQRARDEEPLQGKGEAVQRVVPDHSGLHFAPNQIVKPVQRMAVSRNTSLAQAGGTCGLYSLAMAISGIDDAVVGENMAKQLVKWLLIFGNDVGTFVGEFMDADKLAEVAAKLGVTASVVDFTDAQDMKNKLNGTGGDGVVMAYSVFGVPGYTNTPALATFKYLFAHWSVIENLVNDVLTVRDPNSPSQTRPVNAAAFWQSNQDVATADDKFKFEEYQTRTNRPVSRLRAKWEEENLRDRAEGAAQAKAPLDLNQLPELDLDLKGKMVTVSGAATQLPVKLKEEATLRNEDKTENRKLAEGTEVLILDRNKPGKKFKLGRFSISKEHYWVKTADGTEGWVRKSALKL